LIRELGELRWERAAKLDQLAEYLVTLPRRRALLGSCPDFLRMLFYYFNDDPILTILMGMPFYYQQARLKMLILL
jgi:hypothetical protein